ncbi:hypothetical protein BT96DRAFT_1018286 [Gymnopus androsaceus JB14]|uniref:Uncharacterized protein n=1 Tax=Gymnopus androsaceus JB14 TaxID=1447944 RepID=A0A6A4HX74_9AGAR|nr:hypothetical protein BT96DRAFT_1018286 [Gymnopus androsaceus JB14]
MERTGGETLLSLTIMSEYSETSSTETFSTFTGLGATSGKLIKRVGTVVVNGVDAILIRRRLNQLEATLGVWSYSTTDSEYVKSLYNDLLELSRPVYKPPIRLRALRLIMGRIEMMRFEDLATAVANWPISYSYGLLKTMILCFRDTLPLIDMSVGIERTEALVAYHYTGSHRAQKPEHCAAFLSWLGLTTSLSTPVFSRVLLQLDILSFVTEIYPTDDHLLRPSAIRFPRQRLLNALLIGLEPVNDAVLINQVHRIRTIFVWARFLNPPI